MLRYSFLIICIIYLTSCNNSNLSYHREIGLKDNVKTLLYPGYDAETWPSIHHKLDATKILYPEKRSFFYWTGERFMVNGLKSRPIPLASHFNHMNLNEVRLNRSNPSSN